MFRELRAFISGCSKDMPLEWDWYALGWEGGKEPVVSFDARLVTVNSDFSRFMSLLVLLKPHITVVSENHLFPWVCCVHTCLSWNWVWISLCTWSNCDNILIFSTSSCKLGFHPQRFIPSILKASAPFYPSIFTKLAKALPSQGEGDHTTINLVLKYLCSTTVLTPYLQSL